MKIIVGDIGGTKTLLQLVEIQHERLNVLSEKKAASQNYTSFTHLLTEFLTEFTHDTIPSICLGIAGPVVDEQVKTTNLPWLISSNELKTNFHFSNVYLLNDFQAIGYGLDKLTTNDYVTLQTGFVDSFGPRVVIGAGTGLGEGILVWVNGQYENLPSEGGHVDFAPTDEFQFGLLQYLLARYDRVTYERVLSGDGLKNIYAYIIENQQSQCSSAFKTAMAENADAATITHYAIVEEDRVALETLKHFCKIYGAQAGNLALTCIASGGVYVAGGIAPKIISLLTDGTFIQAFNDKGRIAPLMKKLSVKVVLNTKLGLVGAVNYAINQLTPTR